MGKWVGALLATALGIAVLGPAAPAAARVHTWTGKVTHIADGDTFEIDIAGDGTRTPRRVRMAGIQAMEIGDCHAGAARKRLSRLIMGKTVRLSALDPASRGQRDRLLRAVAFRRDGAWRDAGRQLLREGHALWLPHPVEKQHAAIYNRAAQLAAHDRLRLWDTDSCDPGPQQRARLRMWVQWDADGVDSANLNGEWIRLYNAGSTDVRLGGWHLREAAMHGKSYYYFPRGTVIAAGRSLTVHVGRGRNTARRLYWGRDGTVFPNVNEAGTRGGGAYLFDRDGDLRRWFTYPCAQRCGDPLEGKLEISRVRYDPDGPDHPNAEFADVRNIGVTTVNLHGYLLESWPYGHAFPRRSVLAPGQVLRVRIGRDPGRESDRLVQYWGKTAPILNNSGDSVLVRTFDGVRVTCRSWGRGSC